MNEIYWNTKKFSEKCPECCEVTKFRINSYNCTVSGECKNGHNFNNMDISKFKKLCIRQTNFSYIKCNRCFSLVNRELENYICKNCKYFFIQQLY